jgi:hypothetical protein
MKKLWIILLATLLAFGFGVISCGDGSVPDYSAPAAPGGGGGDGGTALEIDVTKGEEPTGGTGNKWQVALGSNFDEVVAAKYWVIETKRANQWGVGGTQFGIQGDGTAGGVSAWALGCAVGGDWSSYSGTVDEPLWIIIDLAKLPNYAAVISGTNVQLVINWGMDWIDGSTMKWYLTEDDLDLSSFEDCEGSDDPGANNVTGKGIIFFSNDDPLDGFDITPLGN